MLHSRRIRMRTVMCRTNARKRVRNHENGYMGGIMYYGLMKINLICLGRMAKLWCGGHRTKTFIQNALFPP